jgi:hypothetical protein
MPTCSLCGDCVDLGEQWCPSCTVDIEMEIDEMLDGPTPQSD